MKNKWIKILLGAIATILLFGQVKGYLGLDIEKIVTEKETITVIETKYDTIEKIIERVIIKEPIYTNTTKTVELPIADDEIPIGSMPLDYDKHIWPEELTRANLLPDDILNYLNKDSIKVDIPINNYSDTLQVDSATLYYNHDIAGYLQHSDYKIWYPEKTVFRTDTVNITNTVLKNRIFDFMLIGGYQIKPHPEYEIGLDFIARKWKVGVRAGYDPVLEQPTYKAELGVRITGI